VQNQLPVNDLLASIFAISNLGSESDKNKVVSSANHTGNI